MQFVKIIIMEILLILLFIGIIISITMLKNNIPNKPKMIISALSGVILIIWFWLNPDIEIYWKIIITVVVVNSLRINYKLMKDAGIKTNNTQIIR